MVQSKAYALQTVSVGLHYLETLNIALKEGKALKLNFITLLSS